jgi:hypothetical protein
MYAENLRQLDEQRCPTVRCMESTKISVSKFKRILKFFDGKYCKETFKYMVDFAFELAEKYGDEEDDDEEKE